MERDSPNRSQRVFQEALSFRVHFPHGIGRWGFVVGHREIRAGPKYRHYRAKRLSTQYLGENVQSLNREENAVPHGYAFIGD